MTQEEILQLKFLKFFYDQCNVSLRDRIIIEESFECCFNFKVPDSLKVNRYLINDTERDLISKIPKEPKVPNINLDNTNETHYNFNEEDATSLSDIILKLKKITKK
jgi:hypothetical protein